MKTLKTLKTLKTVVTSEYFPASAVLSGVVIFWTLGLFGGLSLLSSSQTPLMTITWLLFVYGAAVLSPLAGALAVADLIRRWRRNRHSHGGLPGGTASA